MEQQRPHALQNCQGGISANLFEWLAERAPRWQEAGTHAAHIAGEKVSVRAALHPRIKASLMLCFLFIEAGEQEKKQPHREYQRAHTHRA